MKKFKDENLEILIVDTRCVHLSLCQFFISLALHVYTDKHCFLPHSGDCIIDALLDDMEKLSEAIVSVVVIHPKVHEKNMNEYRGQGQLHPECTFINAIVPQSQE